MSGADNLPSTPRVAALFVTQIYNFRRMMAVPENELFFN